MSAFESIRGFGLGESTVTWGARYATGPNTSEFASIEIADGRIVRIRSGAPASRTMSLDSAQINLSGYLVIPGLINAHDHLEFALFPRMADPPYRNYIEWGQDIHEKFPRLIARHHAVPKNVRLLWGGIRNLLCGVTTVCHHDPLWPELVRSDFPVRVVSKYGWAHSVALGGDLRATHAATPKDCAFIVHACEGVDELARDEVWELDKLGVLDRNTVLVHGLALDDNGIALLMERYVSLVVCPSSNHFLFGELPDLARLGTLRRVTLGNDSPLTAAGDLLDEIRFTISRCRVTSQAAYQMVTTAAAEILRLGNAEGTLSESGAADLVAIRDTGASPAERLGKLSLEDVEFVMIGGRVQLASERMLERLPREISTGLEPISVGAVNRSVRAPVKKLLRSAEEFLGEDGVRLGGSAVHAPAFAGAHYVC